MSTIEKTDSISVPREMLEKWHGIVDSQGDAASYCAMYEDLRALLHPPPPERDWVRALQEDFPSRLGDSMASTLIDWLKGNGVSFPPHPVHDAKAEAREALKRVRDAILHYLDDAKRNVEDADGVVTAIQNCLSWVRAELTKLGEGS